MITQVNKRWRAILLIGPTGSGKTPLGQLLDLRGLKGKRCIHFDFGNAMRTCIDESVKQLTQDEIRVVRESLMTGTLLEDKHFIIAEKLLLGFVGERKADGDTLVVLNGLPRHIGQAIAMEQFVDMQLLVKLECPPEVVLDRIQMNTGGDRCGRTDDTWDEVRRRVDLFEDRTEPLLNHYRGLMVPIVNVDVRVETTAETCTGKLTTSIHHSDRYQCTSSDSPEQVSSLGNQKLGADAAYSNEPAVTGARVALHNSTTHTSRYVFGGSSTLPRTAFTAGPRAGPRV